MSEISVYDIVPTPKLADKLIGTSVGGVIEDVTYNFTLQELLQLFIPNIPANTLQGVLDYGNTATQNINLTGTITTTNLSVLATANILNSNLSGNTRVMAGLFDRTNASGTAGQFLRSTGTQVEWFTIPTVIPTLQQVLQSGNTSNISIVLTANLTAVTATVDTVISNTSLNVNGVLRDGIAAVGASNQILSSTGSGVRWVDMPVYNVVSPLLYDTPTKTFSIQVASSSQSGYLSSADWINFDGKQDAIILTTSGTSGASTFVGNTLNIPVYTPDLSGYVPISRTLTINGTTYDLSANRSWTIDAGVAEVTATAPLSSSGGAYPDISISQSNSSTDGYLSSEDWLTFNDKQDLLNGTGLVKSTAGTITYITDNSTNWNTAYNDSIVSAAVTGTSTKTLTLNQQDGGTVTANWTDNGLTSVGVSMPSAFSVANSPLTSNGTIAITGAGTSLQYVDGTGALQTFPGLTGFVPYTGATTNVNLGVYSLTASSLIKSGGTSSQFLKADGSVDSSAYITLGSLSAVAPLSYNNATGAFSISQSGASADGYLSSTDWNTFNNKQVAGNYITSLTGEATGTGPGATAVTLNNASVTGKILTGVNITGGTVLATDTMLTAFGKLQNQINGLVGSTIYQGVWDASTNTPTLTSSVGTNGFYYIVNVAGSTNLNGITDWKIGDWAIFNGGVWQKVDNTESVTSVNGFTGAVSLTTDNIAQGTTNLYFANSLARTAVSLTTTGTSGDATYNNTTGVFNIPNYGTALANYLPLTGGTLTGGLFINPANSATVGLDVASNTFTLRTDTSQPFNRQLTTTIGSGTLVKMQAAGYGAVYVTDLGFYTSSSSAINTTPNLYLTGGNNRVGINTTTPAYTLDVVGTAGVSGVLTLGSTISNGTFTYTLPGATGTLALVGGAGVGTVTSVAALTLATTGTDLSSTVANGTTTPVITLNVPTASATNRGALSSADWTTFNGKLSPATAAATYLPLAGGTLTGALGGTTASFSGAVSTNAPSGGATGEGLVVGQSFKIDGSGTSQRAVMYVVSNVLSDTYGSGLQIQGANFADDKGFGFNLNTTGGFELYVKNTSYNKALTIANTNAATFTNTVTATSLIKTGGTAAQFLKADGSVDSTTYGTGTVTSVAALTLGTTGTDLSSIVATGTTTPVITLNVPTASAANRGALSAADWTTFNSKQNALTNPVTGTGTTNYVPKFTGASTIGNSQIFDNGTNVGIGTATPFNGINNTGLNIEKGGHSTLLIGNGYNYGGVVQSSDSIKRVFMGANIYDDPANSWSQFVDSSGYAAVDVIGEIDGGSLVRILNGSGNDSSYGSGNIFFESYKNNSNSYIKLRTNTDNAFYIFNSGNVGLNTTTDAGYKLDVNGTGRFSGAVSVSIPSYTMPALTPSYFGYSSSYNVLILGSSNVAQTRSLAFGVDVSGNPSGAFSGYGYEYIWRNTGSFITPNSANTAYNTLFSWNSSGSLTVNQAATFSSSVTANSDFASILASDSATNLFRGTFVTGNGSAAAGKIRFGGGESGQLRAYMEAIQSWNGSYTDSILNFVTTRGGVGGDIRMTINGLGNVGIGTTSPKTILQINAGSGAYPTLGTNVTNSFFVGRNDGLIGMYLGYAADGNGWIQQMRNDSANAANLILQPVGGNVGIGTTSPATKLEVSTTDLNTIFVTNTATTGATTGSGIGFKAYNGTSVTQYGGIFLTSNTWSFGTYSAQQLSIGADGTGGLALRSANSAPITFFTGGASAGVSTERMRITSGGYVGINTNSPSAYLHINESSYGTGLLITTSSINGADITLTNTGAGGKRWDITSGGSNNAIGAGGLQFYNNTDGAMRMGISSAGNVLIGTSTDAGFPLLVGRQRDGGWQIGFVNGATGGTAQCFFAHGEGYGAYIDSGTLGNSTARYIFKLVSGGTERVVVRGDGLATFSSSITATAFFESSDKTIKTLIQDNYQTKGIESVTAKLYTKNGREELGYYAQDLQGILPSAVSKGADGLLSLSYREVHTAKISALEKRVAELEQQLNLN